MGKQTHNHGTQQNRTVLRVSQMAEACAKGGHADCCSKGVAHTSFVCTRAATKLFEVLLLFRGTEPLQPRHICDIDHALEFGYEPLAAGSDTIDLLQVQLHVHTRWVLVERDRYQAFRHINAIVPLELHRLHGKNLACAFALDGRLIDFRLVVDLLCWDLVVFEDTRQLLNPHLAGALLERILVIADAPHKHVLQRDRLHPQRMNGVFDCVWIPMASLKVPHPLPWP